MRFIKRPRIKSDDTLPEGWEPVQAFARGTDVVVELMPGDGFDDILHNCDAEGCLYSCSSINHVVRLSILGRYDEKSSKRCAGCRHWHYVGNVAGCCISLNVLTDEDFFCSHHENKQT